MRFVSSLIVLLTMVPAVPTGAAPVMPEPGTRIRLTARVPEGKHWVGSFVSLASDTVTLREGGTNGAIVPVPTLHVVSFEVSRGKQGNGLQGAVLGFALGALVGGVFGYISTEENNSYQYGSSRGRNLAIGAAVVGAAGVGVGFAIGSMTHSEQWGEQPLESLRGTTKP